MGNDPSTPAGTVDVKDQVPSAWRAEAVVVDGSLEMEKSVVMLSGGGQSLPDVVIDCPSTKLVPFTANSAPRGADGVLVVLAGIVIEDVVGLVARGVATEFVEDVVRPQAPSNADSKVTQTAPRTFTTGSVFRKRFGSCPHRAKS